MDPTVTTIPPTTVEDEFNDNTVPSSTTTTSTTTTSTPDTNTPDTATTISTTPSTTDLLRQSIIDSFSKYTPSHHNIHLTVTTSESAIDTLAGVTGRSYSADPLTLLFAAERFSLNLPPSPLPYTDPCPPPSPPSTTTTTTADLAAIQSLIQQAHLARLHSKIPHGSFILAANDFTTACCWEPPHSTASQGDKYAYTAEQLNARPIFKKFLADSTRLKGSVINLGDGSDSADADHYWHLSLMSRDNSKPYVPGVVRAVLEPALDMARRNGEKVWLEASTERSRDVYQHAGFRVVGEVWCGVGQVDGWGRAVRKEHEGWRERATGVRCHGMVFDPTVG